MATFKVNKNTNFTVMSNVHLKDPRMSLKSKGLLSFMLSLPETWDYTIRGLSMVVKDGESSISSALKELEALGYLVRKRQRDENGRVKSTEYNIYEEPIGYNPDDPYPDPTNDPNPPKGENPRQENHPPSNSKTMGKKGAQRPINKGENQNLIDFENEDIFRDLPKQENPVQVKPRQEKPVEEKGRQINKDLINTKIINTDSSNTNLSNPIHQDRKSDSMDQIKFERLRIKNQIEFDILKGQYSEQLLHEMVEIMLEVSIGQRTEIMISGTVYPISFVRERFALLDSSHIQYVFSCLEETTTDIRNIRKYLQAVLFSAPTTMDRYYTTKVRHDLCSNF